MVVRTITGRAHIEGRRLSKGFLFQFEIGVEIHLSGFHRLVTKPQSNDAAIHAVLE